MQALVTRPGVAHSTRVEEVAAVQAHERELLLRTLEVGVCGTDREISEGLFGVAPDGEQSLVLGHEALALVERAAISSPRPSDAPAAAALPASRARPTLA